MKFIAENKLRLLVSFVLVFFAIGFAMCVLVRQIIHKALNDNVLCSKPVTLIIGDSHTETSIDPSLMVNAVNVSQSAENYFYTYYKLKYILKNKPQIKAVILGFSYHNIIKKTEAKLINRPAEDYKNYYILLDDDGKKFLKANNKAYLTAYLKYDLGVPLQVYKDRFVVKKLFGQDLMISDFKFAGGYYNSNRSKTSKEELDAQVKERYFTDALTDSYAASHLLLEYLYKIIDLCKSNDIKLYLVNAPIYPYFKERIPSKVVNTFIVERYLLLKKYPEVKYVDLSDLKLSRDCFGDGDHLNHSGAIVMTDIIRKMLDSNSPLKASSILPKIPARLAVKG